MHGLRGALAVWAAALTIHPLPGSAFTGVGARLGGGEWLFPFALLAAGWLASATPRRDLRVVAAGVAPLAIVVVGFAPSVATALDVRVAFVQLLVLAYVAAIFALAHAVTAVDARSGDALLVGLVAGTLVRAAWGWLAPLNDPWLASGWPRPLGGAETPNMIALQSCAAALAVLAVRRAMPAGSNRRVLDAVLVALVVTALATLGHIVFGALVAVAFGAWRTWRRTRPAASAIALVGVLAAIVLLVCSARTRLLPLHPSPPFIDTRPDMYAAAHEIAVETFASAPWTGVGLENFHRTWLARDDGTRFAAYVPEGRGYVLGTPIDPHSTWLGYLAEAGVAGGIAMAALVWLAFRAARKRDDRVLDLGLMFVAATAVIADVLTSRELALVLGVLYGRQRTHRPPIAQ